MKNFKKITIPALVFTIIFAGTTSAFADSSNKNHSQENRRFAVLGSTEVLSNLEVRTTSSENRIDIKNKNSVGAGIHISDTVRASTSLEAEFKANARKEMNDRDERNDEKDDSRAENRNNIDRDNNGKRPWFSWLGRIFGQYRATGTTTASVVATTTADKVPPMIYKKVSFVTASSTTTVTWNTNEQTYGEIRFSTSTASGTPSSVFVDANLSSSHTIAVPNLDAGEKYYVTISAKDVSGNVTTSNVLVYTVEDGLKNMTLSANAFIRLWHNILW